MPCQHCAVAAIMRNRQLEGTWSIVLAGSRRTLWVKSDGNCSSGNSTRAPGVGGAVLSSAPATPESAVGAPRARARLQELGDAEVDHTWMWRLSPHHGAVMETEEYVDSVRLRLGCAGPCEPVPCAACQTGSLDMGAAHAICCALGEATRVHNALPCWYMQRLSLATARLKRRTLGSPLARTCDLQMSSPLPWTALHCP